MSIRSWQSTIYLLFLESPGVIGNGDTKRIVADCLIEDRCVTLGECPKCRAALRVTLDGRQVGLRLTAGLFYNYRCDCGFGVDRVEPAPKMLTGET